MLKFVSIYLFKDHGFGKIDEVFKTELHPLNKEEYPKGLRDEIENIDSIIEWYENFLDPELNRKLPTIN